MGDEQWFVRREQMVLGPYGRDEVQAFVARRKIGPDDLLSRDGKSEWVQLRTLTWVQDEVTTVLAASTPARPEPIFESAPSPPQSRVLAKSAPSKSPSALTEQTVIDRRPSSTRDGGPNSTHPALTVDRGVPPSPAVARPVPRTPPPITEKPPPVSTQQAVIDQLRTRPRTEIAISTRPAGTTARVAPSSPAVAKPVPIIVTAFDPPSVEPIVVAAPQAWFARRDGTTLGPLNRSALRAHFARGDLRLDDQVCEVGAQTWQLARNLPDLADLMPPPPPQVELPPVIAIPTPAVALPYSSLSMVPLPQPDLESRVSPRPLLNIKPPFVDPASTSTPPTDGRWNVRRDGAVVGPFLASNLRERYGRGNLRDTDTVAREGSDAWMPITTLLVPPAPQSLERPPVPAPGPFDEHQSWFATGTSREERASGSKRLDAASPRMSETRPVAEVAAASMSVSTAPAYRLYSPGQTLLASYIGSWFAGAAMIIRNEWVMGRLERAKVLLGVLVLSALGAVTLLACFPDGGIGVDLVIGSLCMAPFLFARKNQKLLVEHHVRAGGVIHSTWRAVGVGGISMFSFLLGIVALLAVASSPAPESVAAASQPGPIAQDATPATSHTATVVPSDRAAPDAGAQLAFPLPGSSPFWRGTAFVRIADTCPSGLWALFAGVTPGEDEFERRGNGDRREGIAQGLRAATFVRLISTTITLGEYNFGRQAFPVSIGAVSDENVSESGLDQCRASEFPEIDGFANDVAISFGTPRIRRRWLPGEPANDTGQTCDVSRHVRGEIHENYWTSPITYWIPVPRANGPAFMEAHDGSLTAQIAFHAVSTQAQPSGMVYFARGYQYNCGFRRGAGRLVVTRPFAVQVNDGDEVLLDTAPHPPPPIEAESQAPAVAPSTGTDTAPAVLPVVSSARRSPDRAPRSSNGTVLLSPF